MRKKNVMKCNSSTHFACHDIPPIPEVVVLLHSCVVVCDLGEY